MNALMKLRSSQTLRSLSTIVRSVMRLRLISVMMKKTVVLWLTLEIESVSPISLLESLKAKLIP